jgi:UDP-2,3-diacylglucosamine hydrolase
MNTQESNDDQIIGLIAGSGNVPLFFAKKAAEKGFKVISIALTNSIDKALKPHVEKNYHLGIGKSEKIVEVLKRENVQGVLMLGKVDKSVLFKPQLFDARSRKFFKRLVTHEDKSLLVGVIKELESEGFSVLDQKEYLSELFPKKGILTKNKPEEEAMRDIEYGFPIAKKLADMEIGQTIVVKNQTVIAVEALEGTNRALERGCSLAKGGCVAIKVCRTGQDYRYDAPGVGDKTIHALIKGKASALAIEAEGVMIAEMEDVINAANLSNFPIIAI